MCVTDPLGLRPPGARPRRLLFGRNYLLFPMRQFRCYTHATSTGEPVEQRPITCDAAEHLPNLEFPTAQPRVMLPKRTFWEKATAVHVFCRQDAQGDRLSRHWHDLVRLDDAGYAEAAFGDRALAKGIAEFKAKFFRENDRDGNPID
jgi:hypothetical protein